MNFKMLLKFYWFAALSTLLIWVAVGWKLGLTALFTVIVLTLLETTFSADNAVVNSKILTTMSPAWQRAFMTVGIFIAVFVVRFALPIIIVMFTADLNFGSVINLALNHPQDYERELQVAGPVISAFGGTFLLMIALSYFIDYEKKTHWLGFLERYLGRLDRYDNITVFITLLVSILIYFTVDAKYQATVLIAAICAMALHIGLELIGRTMAENHVKNSSGKHRVGAAALAAFVYLEILDASFSLDGVIGAFAITSSVILVIAGLGAGAVWVRSMTLHLVHTNALARYTFLEHGAHWAIAFLSGIMLAKLYHVEPPEWIVGSLGLVFIVSAVWWSNRNRKVLLANNL